MIGRRGAAGLIALALFGCGREDAGSVVVEGVGLRAPEAVLHDPEADVYLVSNVGGDPLERDDDGFISRIRPDGALLDAAWIDGARDDVELHAPKGMALVGDRLFVCDIDVVRIFDRRNGALLRDLHIEGAASLDDITVGPGNAVHVVDSGFTAGLAPSGTGAVYRIEPDLRVTTVARSAALEHPSGIGATDRDLFFVTWNPGRFAILPPDGVPSMLVELPNAGLDGLVRAGEGLWLVSSQEGGCIYALAPTGQLRVALDGLDSPASIGWDARRSRVLIPSVTSDRLRFERLAD